MPRIWTSLIYLLGIGASTCASYAQSADSLQPLQADELAQAVAGYSPWWGELVQDPLLQAEAPYATDPDQLVFTALQYSPRIAAVDELPRIQRETIFQAMAEFDTRAFIDSSFADTSDPVGNLLTTGGPNRLNDHIWTSSGGVRKRTLSGLSWEVAQDTGFRNSNSRFFLPNDQGTAQLRLSVTQPLLRGKGKVYNRQPIMMARVQTNAAFAELQTELQRNALAIGEAYWNNYYQRALLIQRRESLKRANEILSTLTNRRVFDAHRGQIARASAEVALREKNLLRAERDVYNSQIEIFRLVGDPGLTEQGRVELIPASLPAHEGVIVDEAGSMAMALSARPEIQRSMQNVKLGQIQLGIARHEVLPRLDLVISSYVSGLSGRSNIGQAWANQFVDGAPSYSAGVVFDMPHRRRAEQARLRQANARLRQLTAQLETTLADVRAEVAVAAGEVITAYDLLLASYEALQAAHSDLESSHNQWALRAGNLQTGSILLENLLDAQQRLSERERDFARAEADYMIAQLRLCYTEGSLLTTLPDGNTASDGNIAATSELPPP